MRARKVQPNTRKCSLQILSRLPTWYVKVCQSINLKIFPLGKWSAGTNLHSSGMGRHHGDASGCKVCSAGRFGAKAGSANKKCSGPCLAGRYGLYFKASTNNLCVAQCPPGRWGRLGEGNPYCSGPCKAGSWGGVPGQTKPTCSGLCGVGKYSAKSGDTHCSAW
jgi:hypothetical protein